MDRHTRLSDELGRLVHERSVTVSPGLYPLGQTWQYTRGSALIGWVGNDVAFLAEQIAWRMTRRSDHQTRFPTGAQPTLCRASRQTDDIVGLGMTMVPRHDECVDLTELSWSPC